MKSLFSRQLQCAFIACAVSGIGLWGSTAAAAEKASNTPAKTVFCAYCHGADGNPIDDAAPRLAGQDADILVAKMKAQIDAIGAHELMIQAFQTGRAMNDRDMKELAAFYSKQSAREPIQRANLYLPAK